MNGRLKESCRPGFVEGRARHRRGGIAQRFTEEGAKIVIADTEIEAGKATASTLGGRFVETDDFAQGSRRTGDRWPPSTPLAAWTS